MKKLLTFVLLLLPFANKAQEYFAPSDIDVSWRVWDNQTTFDWLISNGTKIDVAVNPAIKYSRNSVGSVTEVCLTYVRNNKFLALTFSKTEGIRLFTENDVYKLSDYYSPVQNLMQQYWFNIDFEHIVFSPQLDWLIIPCGYFQYTGYNAIAIMFTNAGVNDVYSTSPGSETEHIYNLDGVEVDEGATKGQILIRTDGKKSVKFLNK